MAKYITYENLETFLTEIREGKMVAGAYDDWIGNKRVGAGHGTIKLGYQYPKDGYLEEIKSYSTILENITKIPTDPGPEPGDNASQEEKDQYKTKKLEYDEYMRIKDSLKSSYSDVRLEDGRAYVKVEDVVYNTDVPNEIETLNAIGGIPEKTKAKDLKGKTYKQLFDDILFPTDNNIEPDGVGVIGLSITPADKLVKLGSTFSKFSNGGTLKRNKWNKYNGDMNVIGPKNKQLFSVKGPTGSGVTVTRDSMDMVNNELSDKYKVCGDYVYKVQIWHSAGTDKPKNNKGDYIDLEKYTEVANYMKAGSKAASITVNVTLPCYVKNTASVFTELPLQKWADNMRFEYEFPQHTVKNKWEFEIPREMKSMELYDPSSGSWKSAADVSLWNKTQTSREFNGIKQNYYKYIYNFNGDKNQAKIKISF